MSREIEDRLRAAFGSKTAHVTESSLRPADPPQDDDQPTDGVVIPFGGRRHRWIPPLLAAAAVVGIVVGTTAVVRISADGHHPRPADTATPPPSSTSGSSPHNTPSKSKASHAAAPGGPQGGGQGSSAGGAAGRASGNSSEAPPPRPPHRIDVQGVVLEVPKSWAVAYRDANGRSCVTVGGTMPTSANPCLLEIQVVRTAANGFRTDEPYVTGDGNLCGSTGGATVTTGQATDAVVGGQAAEYRSYTGSCFAGTWEQWVVPTAPGIVISRSHVDPATEYAVHHAIATATLPGPRSAMRLGDAGLLRSVTPTAGGVRIDLDRVTVLEQGGIANPSTTTYSYLLPGDLQILAPTDDQQPLTVQDLVDLANGKTVHGVAPPIGSFLAYLRTDGNQVTYLSLDAQ